MTSQDKKLEICKSTRKIAADTLYTVLDKVLNSNRKVSELEFRDLWLKELRKHPSIFPDGWYTPPPHGISIIFSSDKNFERTNFKSFRWEEFWPSNISFLDKKNGIIIAYASPVDKKTGIIGDFGLTMYIGKNNDIRDHFKTIINSKKEIFSHVKIGTTLGEIYDYAKSMFISLNLSNDWWVNITDPSGRNIGHTVIGISPHLESKETESLNKEKWETVSTMLSKKRIFVSPDQFFTIKPGDAFTIEHRLKPETDLPIIWFHTIGMFYTNGKKELLTGFDKLFKLTGMNYMLK
jgi:hypothetical protein